MKKFIPFKIVNIGEATGLKEEWLVVYVDHVEYDSERHDDHRRLQPGEITHFWPHLLEKVRAAQKELAFKYETEALWAS